MNSPWSIIARVGWKMNEKFLTKLQINISTKHLEIRQNEVIFKFKRSKFSVLEWSHGLRVVGIQLLEQCQPLAFYPRLCLVGHHSSTKFWLVVGHEVGNNTVRAVRNSLARNGVNLVRIQRRKDGESLALNCQL